MSDNVLIRDEGNIIEVVQGRDLTVCKIVKSDVEIEKLKFIQLADTPDTYVDNKGKTLKVNADENGLEFTDSYDTFISLTDTPASYTGNEGRLVIVNNEGTGLNFVNYSAGSITIQYFTQLADVPASYSGAAGKVVAVKQSTNGLEFKTANELLTTQSGVNAGVYSYPIVTVNNKGLITSIENGVPFEFPPFTAYNLLIGDGSKTPAEVPHGAMYQTLVTTANTGAVAWNWLGSLFDNNGHMIFHATSDSSTNYSTLVVHTDGSNVKLYPETSTNAFILGYNGEFTITSSYSIFDNDVKILSGNEVVSEGPLSLKPETVVKISDDIDPATYASRIINDNDLVTKKYVESHQIDTSNLLKRTASSVMEDNTVVYSLPVGAETECLIVNVTSGFNEGATILLMDSLGNILINEDDIPSLNTSDLIRLYFDDKVVDENYQISVVVSNYEFGTANVYLTYF